MFAVQILYFIKRKRLPGTNEKIVVLSNSLYSTRILSAGFNLILHKIMCYVFLTYDTLGPPLFQPFLRLLYSMSCGNKSFQFYVSFDIDCIVYESRSEQSSYPPDLMLFPDQLRDDQAYAILAYPFMMFETPQIYTSHYL